MAPGRWPGRCAAALWLALLFTAAGLALLLGGVLGRTLYGDLLLYGGGLCLLFGLAWAVLWRVGNLEVPPSQLRDDVTWAGGRPLQRRQGIARLLRSLGRRLTLAPGSAARPASLDVQ